MFGGTHGLGVPLGLVWGKLKRSARILRAPCREPTSLLLCNFPPRPSQSCIEHAEQSLPPNKKYGPGSLGRMIFLHRPILFMGEREQTQSLNHFFCLLVAGKPAARPSSQAMSKAWQKAHGIHFSATRQESHAPYRGSCPTPIGGRRSKSVHRKSPGFSPTPSRPTPAS